MSQLQQNNLINTEIEELRWKDLYRIGAIFRVIVAILVIIAVIVF